VTKVPNDMLPGDYYLIACADDFHQVAELDETNNCHADISTTTVLDLRLPDLVVHGVGAQEQEVAPGGTLTVTALMINEGTATAAASSTGFYLSADEAWDAGDRALQGGMEVPEVAAGGHFQGTAVTKVPNDMLPGDYYLIACADDLQEVTEPDDTNNCWRQIETTRVLDPLVDPGPVVGVCPAPRNSPRFTDVSPGNVHVHAIDCAAYHEIARGYPDGTYGPADGVRRDQMASFIVRTLEAAGHTLPTGEHTFTDVAGNAHERAIGQLAAADIVVGRNPTTYAPAGTVTRDQMASYLVRALDWALGATHTASDSPFTDVAGNTHEQAIHTAFDLDLTTGRTETTYAPRTDVRRDQMASFLVRLLPQAMRTG
jgi:hypothetical protein